MRAKSLLAILLALVLGSGVAFADPTSSATGHVYCQVVKNVAVGVITGNVDLGGIQKGILPGQLIFRVDANVEAVALQVTVTNLYKGDSATPDVTGAVYLIPVDSTYGVLVEPEAGHKIASADNKLDFTGAAVVNGLAGLMTDAVPFESSQNNHFSQNVTLTCQWNQLENELPTGEYSGWVVLTVFVMGNDSGGYDY